MKLLTRDDFLKMLGLNEIKGLMSVSINIDGSSNFVKTTLVVAIEKPETPDFIDIMNSGISHVSLIKVLKNGAN